MTAHDLANDNRHQIKTRTPNSWQGNFNSRRVEVTVIDKNVPTPFRYIVKMASRLRPSHKKNGVRLADIFGTHLVQTPSERVLVIGPCSAEANVAWHVGVASQSRESRKSIEILPDHRPALFDDYAKEACRPRCDIVS